MKEETRRRAREAYENALEMKKKKEQEEKAAEARGEAPEALPEEEQEEWTEPAEFVQVGFTAMRGPDGKFLPAVPIYIRKECGAEEAEESLIQDIGSLFCARMKQYKEECRKAGVAV